ncbi:phage tail tape measure protein [Pseudarthrobacter sp. H2]|uniref:phage tail tape measure protein n=1 Tax=Pseudarthrobacter sp. H2 TaxID=3418415 RepID=UPI003CE6A05F
MASNKINIVISAEDKASKPLRDISNEMDNGTNSSGRFSTALGSLGKVAGVAAVAAGAAAVMAAKFAVTSAADYEQSLNIFQSVSGATAEQMKQVATRSRELGKDISLPGVSAKDASLAMVELAKAGLSVNDSLVASKGVLSLAKAGQMDTAAAAEIAANALMSFGLKGEEANRVADLLAAAANASSAGVSDLGISLSQASAVAAMTKRPVEDVVTQLALMANAGLKGSDAGTSVKSMLMALISPSSTAAGAMKSIGFNAYEAGGQLKTTQKIIQDMTKALEGKTDAQKNSLLADIFGSDGIRAASIIMKDGVAGYDKMRDAVMKQGSAAQLAAAQNAGFNGAMDALKSSLETVAIDVGIKLLPSLTAIVTYLANNVEPAFNAIQGVVKGFLSAIDSISSTVSASVKFAGDRVDDIRRALGDAAKAVSDFKDKAIAELHQKIKEGKQVWQDFKGWIEENETAIKSVSTVLGVVFGPALAIAAGKAAVAGVKIAASGVAAGAGWVAGSVAASIAWTVNSARMIALSAGIYTMMAIDAVKAGASWTAGAVVSSFAWVLNMAKVAGVSSLTAIKVSLSAADAGWAWVFNATRASFVWAVTELPKIVAAAAVTAVQSTIHAATTSAAWIASAARSAFAWVATELPRIVAGFALTSGAAVTHALVASGAWIASASASAVAWVVTELPRIIAAFVAMSASAIANAAIASGAWIASAVSSSAAVGALSALVATPMVMPAIAVAAAIASLFLVVDAANRAKAAVAEATAAKASLAEQDKKDLAVAYSVINSGVASPERKAAAQRIINNVNNRHALGTSNAPGGATLVGEMGPEIVNMPQGAQVVPAYRTRSTPTGGGGASINIENLTIANQMDQQRFLADLGWRLSLR